jgi:hypothetical protein
MAFFLERQKTSSTPYVLIDEAKHYMKLEGESFHENIIVFFLEIKNWLAEYMESDFEVFTLDFDMKYFNSSTVKILFDMLTLMDSYSIDGKTVVVNWYLDKDDEMSVELCNDFQEDLEHLKINMVSKR